MQQNWVIPSTPTPAKDLKPGEEVLLWGLVWKVRSVLPLLKGRAQINLERDPDHDEVMIACSSFLLVDKL